MHPDNQESRASDSFFFDIPPITLQILTESKLVYHFDTIVRNSDTLKIEASNKASSDRYYTPVHCRVQEVK